MDEQDEPRESDEIAPRKPRRKPEPKTIRIQSSNPIPPGRIDYVPPSRQGPLGMDPRILIILAVSIAALVAIGIAVLVLRSDGNDPDPAAAASPTSAASNLKDRFVARGDALCKRANRAQERLLFPDSPEEFDAYLADTRGIVTRLIRDLDKMKKPKEDRALLARMFKRLEKVPALLSDARAAAAAGDVTGMEQILARGERIEHQANSLALEYGFVECSQP